MPRWVLAVLILLAVYFPAAIWLRGAYVDPAPKGQIVVQILPPFERYGAAAIKREPYGLPSGIGDREDVEGDTNSPVVIYEDTTRLGPAHCTFAEISGLGMGRFAHWRGQGIAFSASDNSDPSTNGRRYWAVVP